MVIRIPQTLTYAIPNTLPAASTNQGIPELTEKKAGKSITSFTLTKGCDSFAVIILNMLSGLNR